MIMIIIIIITIILIMIMIIIIIIIIIMSIIIIITCASSSSTLRWPNLAVQKSVRQEFILIGEFWNLKIILYFLYIFCIFPENYFVFFVYLLYISWGLFIWYLLNVLTDNSFMFPVYLLKSISVSWTFTMYFLRMIKYFRSARNHPGWRVFKSRKSLSIWKI